MKHVEFAHGMAMELGYAPLTILLCISSKGKANQKDEKSKNKGEEHVAHVVRKK